MTDLAEKYQLYLSSANNLAGSSSNPANSTLQVNLQYPINFTGYEVCLQNCFINYSWPNITANYGDNQLQYIWVDGTTYNVNFPDGQYGISDIGNFVQFVMGQNGHYLVDNNGNYVFYISILVNATQYAAAVNCIPVPSSLPSGWTNPNGIPLTGLTPQLIIPNPSASATYTMNQLLGFNSGTYPPTAQTTLYQINSNGTGNAGIPEISPVIAVSINLNIISQGFFNSNPQTICTFSPSVPYGEQISIIPSQLYWLSCVSNQVSQIQITFTDQNGQLLYMKDPSIVINLYFKKKEK